MSNLIEQIKKYCTAKYDEGYDTIIECYSDAELQELITEEDIINLGEFVDYYAPILEHRRDIEGTAF